MFCVAQAFGERRRDGDEVSVAAPPPSVAGGWHLPRPLVAPRRARRFAAKLVVGWRGRVARGRGGSPIGPGGQTSTVDARPSVASSCARSPLPSRVAFVQLQSRGHHAAISGSAAKAATKAKTALRPSRAGGGSRSLRELQGGIRELRPDARRGSRTHTPDSRATDLKVGCVCQFRQPGSCGVRALREQGALCRVRGPHGSERGEVVEAPGDVGSGRRLCVGRCGGRAEVEDRPGAHRFVAVGQALCARGRCRRRWSWPLDVAAGCLAIAGVLCAAGARRSASRAPPSSWARASSPRFITSRDLSSARSSRTVESRIGAAASVDAHRRGHNARKRAARRAGRRAHACTSYLPRSPGVDPSSPLRMRLLLGRLIWPSCRGAGSRK